MCRLLVIPFDRQGISFISFLYPQWQYSDIQDSWKWKNAAQDDAAVQAAVQAVTEALGDTGRILVRESGTEPVLRVMVEAETKEICQKYVSQVVDVVKEKGYVVA